MAGAADKVPDARGCLPADGQVTGKHTHGSSTGIHGIQHGPHALFVYAPESDWRGNRAPVMLAASA